MEISLKKISAFLVLLLFVCLVPMLVLGQGLRNSHHDFSGSSWSNHEVCRPCHVPHNADMTVPDSPLWSHQVTTASFAVYASNTTNAVIGQPNGNSKLCLSCHDGTVAIENFGGFTGGTTYATFGNFGTDMSNDHPISFLYDAALANTDGKLKNPLTTLSGLGGTIAEDLLENGNMECTSCHDVHLSRNTNGCSSCHSIHPMKTVSVSLWKSNTGSQLCLTCHNK